MAKIVSIHSFRGGTGKSNLSANIAALLCKNGQRVGVLDTDIQSPGLHILFGLAGQDIDVALNDYLWHDVDINRTAHDVTPGGDEFAKGKVFLIPSSIKPGEITRVLREGYDAQRLTEGIRHLLDEFELDMLIIDTHPGINEETLLSLVISHQLFVVMRPDQQDYEGTDITIRVARQLEVPEINIIINKKPPSLDANALKSKVETTYGCPVMAILPHSDDLMELASTGIFAVRFPDHPMTALCGQIVQQILL